MDRDQNAAINILRLGLQSLPAKVSPDAHVFRRGSSHTGCRISFSEPQCVPPFYRIRVFRLRAFCSCAIHIVWQFRKCRAVRRLRSQHILDREPHCSLSERHMPCLSLPTGDELARAGRMCAISRHEFSTICFGFSQVRCAVFVFIASDYVSDHRYKTDYSRESKNGSPVWGL